MPCVPSNANIAIASTKNDADGIETALVYQPLALGTYRDPGDLADPPVGAAVHR